MEEVIPNSNALTPSPPVEQPAPIVVQSAPTKNYPGFSTLLGFGALGLIGYFLISKTQDKREDKEQKKREQEFSDNFTNAVLKDSAGRSYNPKELAARYKQAIFGAGTSEQALMDLARISKNGRWQKISEAYKNLTKNALNNDLQGDLSTEEFSMFQKILKSKYWFAVGEYVYPKQAAIIVYENGKIKGESFYWTHSTGKAIGKIRKAKKIKYKGKILTVYLTSGYPSKWIVSKYLITKYDGVI